MTARFRDLNTAFLVGLVHAGAAFGASILFRHLAAVQGIRDDRANQVALMFAVLLLLSGSLCLYWAFWGPERSAKVFSMGLAGGFVVSVVGCELLVRVYPLTPPMAFFLVAAFTGSGAIGARALDLRTPGGRSGSRPSP